MTEVVIDAERYPTLTEDGRRMLQFLQEHPHAPVFRNESGNRLTVEDLGQVRAFEQEVRKAEVGWRPGTRPEWLNGFVKSCLAEVPFYRRYGSTFGCFEQIPTTSRVDLSADIAQFVPDHVPVERMMHFATSGTTGHRLLIPSHPIVAANYLAFHKRALLRFGIELRHGQGQVGVVLAGFQKRCFTYVSVTPTMEESGLVKLNLHPDEWKDPSDRAQYLDALAPEVYTGDPIAFAELARLPLRTKPRALLSTSMALLPGLKEHLETRFGCPVLDIYSMNETGPLAVFDREIDGHVLLQHRLFVEILDPKGNVMEPGTRGEITLTGGFNFCLPLLRYRTGDFASLEFVAGVPVLRGLEGRPPVRFRTMAGEWLNNIEVTHALQQFAMPQFVLRQESDGALLLRMSGSSLEVEKIRESLLALFGPSQPLTIEAVAALGEKVVQYTSALEGSSK
jgi:phenylacetate-CoA ligase